MLLNQNPTKYLYTVAGVGLCLVLSACQSKPQPPDQAPAVNQAESQPESEFDTDEVDNNQYSDVRADLLYDLLVASIASRRGNPELALESLSRAAYQSRNKRLIAEAIQLAMDHQKYQQASDLAMLLNSIDPDNHLVILSLANAQFSLGESDDALSLLITLASSQSKDRIFVLQDIASLLSQQDQQTILSQYLDAIEDSEDQLMLVMTAALLASRLDNPEQFHKLIDDAIGISPDWEVPSVIKLTFLAGHSPESVDDFSLDHLNRYPEHSRFQLQYARTLIQRDEYNLALDHLNQILVQNPESPDALYTAGVIYLDLEDYEKSKQLLGDYLKLDQQNDQVRIYLGDIAIHEKDYDAAAKHYHSVSSQQHYIDAQVKLSRMIAEKDSMEMGLKHLQQIDTLNNDEITRLILEQDALLRDYNLYHRSKLVLDDGLKRFPNNPDLLYNRGLLAAQLELLDLHEQDMRKLIEIEPDNAHAYNALGYTLADKTDRLEEALILISKANALLPDNPFILDSMGWIHFRLGDHEKALLYLQQALEGRKDAEIAAHLGEVLWALGEKDEAMEIWQQGTQWGPDNAVLKETIERFTEQHTSNLQLWYSPLSGFHIEHPGHSISPSVPS